MNILPINHETITVEAEELCGSCTLPSQVQVKRDDFELSFTWPPEMGLGMMKMVRLRPGFMLGIGNFRLSQVLTVPYEMQISPIVFGSCLLGRVRYSIESEEGPHELCYESGQSFISYIPKHQGVAKPPSDLVITLLGVYAETPFLQTLLADQFDVLAPDMRRLISGDEQRYCCRTALTTPDIQTIIRQIFECPYKGPLRRLYLESKALELITINLAQTTVEPVCAGRGCCPLRPHERERVHQARELVERDLQNPPKLLDLARTVGMPHPKLNSCFREAFGTTVFGYLRDIRLNRAKMLLDEGAMNVSEVAYEVGYSSLSHFAKAFKNQFGDLPCRYLRESTFLKN